MSADDGYNERSWRGEVHTRGSHREFARGRGKPVPELPLYKDATQMVFGHGEPDAPIMLVGEQPGDREDTEGVPFVGPAGRLIARALNDANIDAETTFQTNAVKHFKFTRKSGKRRTYQKSSRTEVGACQLWLIAEIEAVQPQVVVCLGATAPSRCWARRFGY